MTTIASHSYTAPTFGNKTHSEKPKRSPFFYRQTQGKVNLNRFERIKAYGNGKHLEAGYKEAQQWFDGKTTMLGKAIAIGTLAAAWGLDFVMGLGTVGVWTGAKLFWPDLNISGLGRAFHYGVHKSYEQEKQNRATWKNVKTDILDPVKEIITKTQDLVEKIPTK